MNTADPRLSHVPPPPHRRSIQRFVSAILIAVGVMFVLLMIAVPSNGSSTEKEGAIVVLVFGAMLIVGGLIWFRSAKGRDTALHEQYQERSVLAVAARHGGRATIAQITLETSLSAAEAEQVVNRLCGRNIAQPDVLDDGTVVYLFGALSPV